ncbi:MAG: diguanylate cyclase [Candidatus Omnitrophica bacterium]|nr:diguanylate cyclase [Candidatus Omnitrophota bacterium]MCM8827953.1 diguanylate cyclase [Candidatus Omnitrophota bacterium]
MKEGLFYKIIDSLYEGVYIIDTDRKILYWNKAAQDMTGYHAEEVVGKSCRDNILRHTDREGNELCLNDCPMAHAMETGKQVKGEVYLHHKSGYRLLVNVTGIPVIENGKVEGLIELFNPVLSSLKDHEQDLLSLALKDPLTKLYNRKGFEFICPLRQREMLRLDYKTGILFIDIDDFKKINDKFGHDTGDRVLYAMAKMLNNLLRHSDIAVRWGGEEFVSVVFVKDENSLITTGNKFLQLVQSTFITHNEETIKFTISAGGTIVKKEENIEDAIARADNLMYQAKKQGKNKLISDI